MITSKGTKRHMNRDEPIVILDDTKAAHGNVTLFEDASSIITTDEPAQVETALTAIEVALMQGAHVAGYFSYELGYVLESKLAPLIPHSRKVPLLWFGAFRKRREIALASVAAALRGRAYAGPPKFEESLRSYGRAFSLTKGYIAAGDIYQANLTFRGRFPFVGDPLALYLQLRETTRGAYSAFVFDGTHNLLSFSPELFFAVCDGEITARPMKGTAARGASETEDAVAKDALAASEKDRAENLMIVDLIRNDLGRVTKPGSIRVENLFEIETYPTVHQMVSTVRGKLRENVRPRDVIHALFPCGSVTGTPRIRAMEVIRELERDPRGVYCGAIGVFGPDGSAQFNVAIRTITIADGAGELGVGGAVVADSELQSEYDECLLKARHFTETRRPLSLIETLRFDPATGFTREKLHLARMECSARAFGIRFDKSGARRALAICVRGAGGPSRVRLTLDENGVFGCDRTMLTEQTLGRWTYALASTRVQSSDEILRHKTNWREDFENEWARQSQLQGCDDVIFTNERGEVTEGARTNVFARYGKRLVTPALDCGLLGGCLRRELLDKNQCEEGVLTPADLERADQVFLGNSLRGLIPAAPVAEARRAIA